MIGSNEVFKVTMDIGIIDKKFADRFNWPNQGIIGLAPDTQDSTDQQKYNRQFLYQVAQQYPGYEESYALLGGSTYWFVVGATVDKYK